MLKKNTEGICNKLYRARFKNLNLNQYKKKKLLRNNTLQNCSKNKHVKKPSKSRFYIKLFENKIVEHKDDEDILSKESECCKTKTLEKNKNLKIQKKKKRQTINTLSNILDGLVVNMSRSKGCESLDVPTHYASESQISIAASSSHQQQEISRKITPTNFLNLQSNQLMINSRKNSIRHLMSQNSNEKLLTFNSLANIQQQMNSSQCNPNQSILARTLTKASIECAYVSKKSKKRSSILKLLGKRQLNCKILKKSSQLFDSFFDQPKHHDG